MIRLSAIVHDQNRGSAITSARVEWWTIVHARVNTSRARFPSLCGSLGKHPSVQPAPIRRKPSLMGIGGSNLYNLRLYGPLASHTHAPAKLGIFFLAPLDEPQVLISRFRHVEILPA